MGQGTHTEGPWEHHFDIACKCGLISGKDYPVARVYKGDWGDDYPSLRLVGSSLDAKAEAYMEQITYGHIPEDVAEANARLVAAAPDLLEACKAALSTHLLTESEPGLPSLSEVEAKLRAAIRKATGEA